MQVFLHHVYIEAALLLSIKKKFCPMFGGWSGSGALDPGIDRDLARNAVFLSQQDTFAEAEHLYGETEVNGNFHHHCLPIPTYISNTRSNVKQNRFDLFKGGLIATNHERRATFSERDQIP